jgi:hypothetical protein
METLQTYIFFSPDNVPKKQVFQSGLEAEPDITRRLMKNAMISSNKSVPVLRNSPAISRIWEWWAVESSDRVQLVQPSA